jgi:hypothetical protein
MGLGLAAVLLLLVAATASVFWPLRAARKGAASAHGDLALQIARDAKLGELHDLELDYRLGKLSSDDYEQLNEALRTEAVEILRQIDSEPANGNGNGKVAPVDGKAAVNGARSRRKMSS